MILPNIVGLGRATARVAQARHLTTTVLILLLSLVESVRWLPVGFRSNVRRLKEAHMRRVEGRTYAEHEFDNSGPHETESQLSRISSTAKVFSRRLRKKGKLRGKNAHGRHRAHAQGSPRA
ncbi:MAG: hypothetical protein ACT4P6_09360 [Gemmatimonadaceae bacterium]